MATRRFQGSRTGVRLIPPVTSSGEEGMRCRETGSTTWGSEVEGGGNWWQEEVEPSGGEERERETRERRAEGGMNVEARVGLEVDRKKGSRVALLSSRGLKTFRSVRYAVSYRGCRNFRALIKEIREGGINFCTLLDLAARRGDTVETPWKERRLLLLLPLT